MSVDWAGWRNTASLLLVALALGCAGRRAPQLPLDPGKVPAPAPAQTTVPDLDQGLALKAALPKLLAEARRSPTVTAWRDWLCAASHLALVEKGRQPWAPVLAELTAQPEVLADLGQDLRRLESVPARVGPVALAACLLAEGGETQVAEALALLPEDNPATLELRALALAEEGRPALAAQALSRLATAQPGRRDLPLRAGIFFLAAGQARQAMPWARQAVALDSVSGQALLLMADLHLVGLRECRALEPDFDDKLICLEVERLCARVREDSLLGGARRRREQVAGWLPSAEDRFFNHYEQARKACYQWLLP